MFVVPLATYDARPNDSSKDTSCDILISPGSHECEESGRAIGRVQASSFVAFKVQVYVVPHVLVSSATLVPHVAVFLHALLASRKRPTNQLQDAITLVLPPSRVSPRFRTFSAAPGRGKGQVARVVGTLPGKRCSGAGGGKADEGGEAGGWRAALVGYRSTFLSNSSSSCCCFAVIDVCRKQSCS